MLVLGGYFLWAVFDRFLKKQVEERVTNFKLSVILSSNLVFYAVYSLTPFGSYITNSWSEAIKFAGITLNNFGQGFDYLSLGNIPRGLQNVVQMWVGGVFGNALMLFLSVAGMVAVMGYAKRFKAVLMLWVMVSSLALIVGSPETNFFYRVLYLVPFQIFAAAGFYWIFDKIENTVNLSANKTFQILRISAFVLVALLFLNYSLRSVDSAPFYTLG
jgi:hypothetical protein